MDRREALKRITVLMGGAVSVSTVTAVLGGCKSGPATQAWAPRTLTADQNDLVVTITEMIIPETDTPGAKAAGVNEFIDLMLTEWHTPQERDGFLAGLATVDTFARQAHGKTFLEASPEERTAVLQAMEQDAIRRDKEVADLERDRAAGQQRDADRRGEQEADAAADQEEEERVPGKPFFNLIKEMTLAGYYTSEIGATQELRHQPVFPTYDGCLPLGEVGRTWA